MIARLQRFLGPLNTRLVGYAGASLVSSQLITIARLMADWHFWWSGFNAVYSHVDPYNSVLKMSAALVGIAVGSFLAYVGRPGWYGSPVCVPAPSPEKETAK